MDIFAYISGPKHSDTFKLVDDKFYGLLWEWYSGERLMVPVFLIEDNNVYWNTMRVKFREEHLSCPVVMRLI